jgi:hypothetical protein
MLGLKVSCQWCLFYTDRTKQVTWKGGSLVKESNPSVLLALVGWVSLFILTWLIVVDVLPVDWIRVSAWLFFLVIGIFASAMSLDRKK